MSITQKITALAPYIPQNKLAEYEDIANVLLKYAPEYLLERLTELIKSGDYDKKECFDLVDGLQVATAQHMKPEPQRYNSYKTDLERFFDYLNAYIRLDNQEGALYYLGKYHEIFGTPKKRCARILLECHKDGCDGRFTSIDQYECEVCGTHRYLCKRKPMSNGRCHLPGHGGRSVAGPLNDRFVAPGRAKIYGTNLQGDLQQMYIDAVTDPEYLSVAPEIAALAARSGELMRDIGDTDYLAVSTQVRQAIRDLRRAANEDDIHAMLHAADEIETQLVAVADDKRRWDEIAAISGRLGRLTETERKRIIEAQKVITVQEMYALQQETLMQIRDAFAVVAADVVKQVERGKDITQPKLRRRMLTTLHGIMEGDIPLEKNLENDEPLIIEAESSEQS